jgi:hypothetical protein
MTIFDNFFSAAQAGDFSRPKSMKMGHSRRV